MDTSYKPPTSDDPESPSEVTFREIATFFGVPVMSVRNTFRGLVDGQQMYRNQLWAVLQTGVSYQRDALPKRQLPRQLVRAEQKARIIERDGNRCRYCDRATTSATRCIDHVLPWARGGRNFDVNLVVCCVYCNASKGARTVVGAEMMLRPCLMRDNRLDMIQQGLAAGVASYQHMTV